VLDSSEDFDGESFLCFSETRREEGDCNCGLGLGWAMMVGRVKTRRWLASHARKRKAGPARQGRGRKIKGKKRKRPKAEFEYSSTFLFFLFESKSKWIQI
jgi:hypothetical protein